VHDTEAAAERGLVIAKHVVGETKARVPVVLRGIGDEGVWHGGKPAEGGGDDVVQQIVGLGRVRLPFIAQATFTVRRRDTFQSS